MESKRLYQNSQMDMHEVMKKVVSLENTLVLQAKEIELQSNEIKCLKQMLSKNICTHHQSIYRLPAKGQENLKLYHHHDVVQQPHSGVPLSAIRQPKRYSREFLNNVRYSTGAANYSSYTMNPLVHPSTAIPPINLPPPMAGIINKQPPPTPLTNNNNNTKSDANQSSFKLKPSRLHISGTSLQPSLPVTSNGHFEPSISVNGFRHDDSAEDASSTGKLETVAHQRQGFVEILHNNSTNIAKGMFSTPPNPARSFFWKPPKEVSTKRHTPELETIETRSVELEYPNMRQVPAAERQASMGADSETSDALDTTAERLDLKPRENDNPCRCPTLYSVTRRGREKVARAADPDEGDDEYSVDELTSEEQEKEEPYDGKLYLPNPRAEKARLIIPKRDEKTMDYRFKFINRADELEESEAEEATNDLAKSCLSISGWPSLKCTQSVQFLSSTSPKKKALKLDLSSKFTIQDFINNQTLS